MFGVDTKPVVVALSKDAAVLDALIADVEAAWSKCPPWQRPHSPPVPFQGAPGGFGRLSTPRIEVRPLSAQPRPQVLELAAFKVADFTAFDHQVEAKGRSAEARVGPIRAALNRLEDSQKLDTAALSQPCDVLVAKLKDTATTLSDLPWPVMAAA